MSDQRWCPTCGAEVQPDWATCKFCRHDFAAAPPLSYDRSALTSHANRRRRKPAPATGTTGRRAGRSIAPMAAIGVLAIAVFGVAVGASGVLDHEPPPNDTPVTLASGWVTVSPGGGFRAELPVEPAQGVTERNVGDVTLQVSWFTAEQGEEAYAVGYVDYPAEVDVSDPAATLAGVPDGAAAEVQGAVRSSSATTFAGHPAIDYEVVSPQNQVAEATAVLVGSRLYVIQAMGPLDHRPQFTRLRDSFTLIPGP